VIAFVRTHRSESKIEILRMHHNSTYDAFEILENTTGGTENNYLFASQQYDKTLGEQYLRDKYSNSSLGRFSRQDVWGGGLEQPITLQKYIYAHNNPVNLTDPTGLFIGSLSEFSASESMRKSLETSNSARATAALEAFLQVSQSTIGVLKAVARAYATAQETVISLARQFKVPILFYGSDIPETTTHVSKALFFSGYTNDNPDGYLLQSKFISPVLSRVPEQGRSWYRRLPVYRNKPARTWLDEFPYATTAQGGDFW
jgi:RHS repeat-associated protein